MKLIYNNFDGLDVAFQGAFSEDILQALAEAKEQAQATNNKDVVIQIGVKKQLVSVAPTAAKGGYAYRFDTGPDGATWFVKRSENRKNWNIRVSLKSLNLALNGYEKARDNILAMLDDFGVCGCWYSLDGDLIRPEESVGRIDYCFDFHVDEFDINPANIVVHSQTTVREIEPMLADVIRRANRIETIMLGKMPNRQVEIYDKTIEIKKKNKTYWWDIWGLDKDTFQGRIMRVEVRAGKEELRNWNVGSFYALEFCMGDIMQRILRDIRYTIPTDDTNRSRWPLHPLWIACQERAKEALAPYTTNAERKKIIKDLRENIINRAQKNLRGSIATYSHLLGHRADEIAQTLEVINEDVSDFASTSDFRQKQKKAKDKYVFLDEVL